MERFRRLFALTTLTGVEIGSRIPLGGTDTATPRLIGAIVHRGTGVSDWTGGETTEAGIGWQRGSWAREEGSTGGVGSLGTPSIGACAIGGELSVCGPLGCVPLEYAKRPSEAN